MSSKTGGPAYKASHTGKYECSAEAMWKSLSQWEPDYLTKVDKPAGESKDVKGSGVGAVRTVMAAGPDGTVAEWGEKVTAFDAEKMTYSYTVTSAVPFPIGVETFLWTCKVKSLGPNKCEATVGCVFDSEAPDAMMGMLPAMYKTWADNAFDFAVKPRPTTGARKSPATTIVGSTIRVSRLFLLQGAAGFARLRPSPALRFGRRMSAFTEGVCDGDPHASLETVLDADNLKWVEARNAEANVTSTSPRGAKRRANGTSTPVSRHVDLDSSISTIAVRREAPSK